MRLVNRIAMGTAVLALAAAPAVADGAPGKGKKDTQEAKQYRLPAPGKYCKEAGASKKKVAGQKKSAFAECVVAQAKLRKGRADTARQACKGATRKKAKGQKRSSYSTCIRAAKARIRDQKAQQS